MAYRVVYDSVGEREKCEKTSVSRIPLFTAAFLLLFLLLLNICWPSGREVLQQILWPGDAEVTRQAAETLVEDLRMGEPITEALEAFCRDIITEADIAAD